MSMAPANKSGEEKVNSDQASKPLLFHGILFLTGKKSTASGGPAQNLSVSTKVRAEGAARVSTNAAFIWANPPPILG